MKWVVIALVLCFGYLQFRLWVGEGSIAEVVNLNKQIVQQQSEIESLNEQNRVLALEVSELKTGVRTLEERARSEMGMIKEGETFILVLDENGESSANKEPSSTPKKSKSSPQATSG